MSTEGDLITGLILTQAVLVRMLEDAGVIDQGAFHDALAAHLASVAPERRDAVMYEPMRQLMKSLPPLPGRAKI